MSAARAPVRNLTALLLAGVALSACATVHPTLSNRLPTGAAGQASQGTQPAGKGGVYKVGNPYQVGGIWYVPKEDPAYDHTGVASWYGDEFHMKATANGETFDMHAISAAHTTLPMPSLVEVTNLDNGRKLVVRVNDRGPFVGDRIIDLSREAARQLGYDQKGLANVRVRYLGSAPLGVGEGTRYAAAGPARPVAPQAAVPAPIAVVAARPLAPPAPVGAQSLPPAAAAPARYETSSASVYGRTGETYAPTAMPGYAPPVQPAYRPTYSAQADSPAGRPAPAGGAYRVQAGAYSNPDAAQRVASQLASAGPATVEPVSREDGATLYRVMLQASNDEAEAWALRDRVAASGYADARVIRPF
ncbi:septal ring lytic transglycosylase RlpA family protein [Phenylobacterium sp.]|jgi:rare lipoprotein A|uniref:septal ring lytic transglycosylase RlpA family protein n=1 Tax=Phenylobacterium sp. TaxID=1871053 RepID=UPI002F41516C